MKLTERELRDHRVWELFILLIKREQSNPDFADMLSRAFRLVGEYDNLRKVV